MSDEQLKKEFDVDPRLLEMGKSGFPVAFEQAMDLLFNELKKIVLPECKVTILIRTPEKPDNDICWSEDDPTDVKIMAERCYYRQISKEANDGNSK